MTIFWYVLDAFGVLFLLLVVYTIITFRDYLYGKDYFLFSKRGRLNDNPQGTGYNRTNSG